MRHVSVSLALAIGLSGQALAQLPEEARLEGGAPDRICSAADIEAARSGSYAGPPCRFTSDDLDGWSAEVEHAPVTAHRSAMSSPRMETQVYRVRSEYEQADMSRVRVTSGSTHALRSYPPETSAWTSGQRSGRYAQETVREYRASSETSFTTSQAVQLDESFFNSRYAGGVAPHPPVYAATPHPVVVYRDAIAIRSDGSARFWDPAYGGIYSAQGLPRRIEERPYRARPVMNGPVSRAYRGPVSRAYRMSTQY